MNPKNLIIAIYRNLEEREFDSIKSALNSQADYVAVGTFSKWHTTAYGNDYAIYNYSFINSNSVEELPSYRNWKIRNIKPANFTSRTNPINEIGVRTQNFGPGFTVEYSDPLGNLFSETVFGPTEAISLLFELSLFNNKLEYELNTENKKLKIEINYLNKQILKLNETISKLENN